MPTKENHLAERSGNLVETHQSYDPRIVFFYFVLAALLLTLVAGLAYQQLRKTSEYADAERQQNQRRILYPGPRGNIEDRNGNVLVNNRARFSVRLLLDQLRSEFRKEQDRIKKNYAAMDDKEIPSYAQRMKIARVSVVQRYLDQVNAIIGRFEKVKADELHKHFDRELLLPFSLIDDLEPGEYARLLERLPVNSPAQVYTLSTRHYPYGSAASHTLGYVGANEDVQLEDFPGEDLRTFKMKGTMGREGVEKRFDSVLQGEAGGAIFRVDPAGNRINPPIQQVFPKQGKKLQLSLDIDLQIAAEAKMAEAGMAGAAVALDVATGEVLVLASKPDYDLSAFVPRLSPEAAADINKRGAWYKRAIQGAYPPGSSFKILTTIAGFRSGHLTPTSMTNCPGAFVLGRAKFNCHDGHAHGDIGLGRAIEKSCNVFFYKCGYEMGADIMAIEARRFHLDRPTGIDLLDETRRMVIPDEDWKRKTMNQGWVGGDTVQMAIGQGAIVVTPLQMACFAASVARDEVWTQPTIIHDPNRPRQHNEPIGLSRAQRETLIQAMEQVTLTGTARILTEGRLLPKIPGLRIGGKTGTAQVPSSKGILNIAWFIGFAPIENPQIAIAIAIEGDTPGEETGGGLYAAPVAHAILKAWAEKKNRPANLPLRFKTE
jgi:penicillin-binding protein 2